MTQEKDLCPISDNGNHRYFIFKVVEVFEPFNAENKSTTTQLELRNMNLFEKVEYAVSGCNCGSAIKQRVKQR